MAFANRDDEQGRKQTSKEAGPSEIAMVMPYRITGLSAHVKNLPGFVCPGCDYEASYR